MPREKQNFAIYAELDCQVHDQLENIDMHVCYIGVVYPRIGIFLTSTVWEELLAYASQLPQAGNLFLLNIPSHPAPHRR